MNPVKKSFLVAGVLMAFVAAVGVASAGAKTYVPFKGTNGAVLTVTPTSNPFVYDFTGSGGGEATHLGRFTYAEEGSIDFLTLTVSGSWTYTAANGDTLYGAYTIPWPPASMTTYPIGGGTGRFAGATGEVTVDLHLVASTTDTFTYRNTLTGTISTVGSLRGHS